MFISCGDKDLPAEQFYDIPRTLSVAFPTSEKTRRQETGLQ